VGPDENGVSQNLGAEKTRPFFTRAVLLDFVNNFTKTIGGQKKKAGKILPASYIITLEDVMKVMAAQDVGAPQEGDVVIFYTGWDRFFGDLKTSDMLGDSPGIGVEVADWLAAQKVAMVGADNLAVEAMRGFAGADDFPPGHPFENIAAGLPQPVHLVLLTQHGIHLLELMNLEELANSMLQKYEDADDDDVDNPYDFAFVYSTVPIRGLPGSPGRPLAID
jgi:kynurenine formamidase